MKKILLVEDALRCGLLVFIALESSYLSFRLPNLCYLIVGG